MSTPASEVYPAKPSASSQIAIVLVSLIILGVFIFFGLTKFEIVILVFFLLGILVQFTWNYTLPDLFGVKTTSYYQALALLVLFTLLLGPRWCPLNWINASC